MAKAHNQAVNIWTARAIPLVLMGVVGYATYVLVVRLCVRYLLLGPNRQDGTVVALLIVYFLLFLLMATTYFRILWVITLDPGFVPLGRVAPPVPHSKRSRKVGARNDGAGNSGTAVGAQLASEYEAARPVVNWHTDADAPGLERFYSKDVFVCQPDGKPIWCTECGNWKPDRTHHCSDVGRCVTKMDHFCPWVGGVVAENTFKFFIQFVFYTCIYCIFLLVVMAFYLSEQMSIPGMSWDTQFAGIIGLAAFFGLFTFGMTASSVNFAVSNLTTIENLNKKTKAYQLAVFIPDPKNTSAVGVSGIPYPTVTYPLPLTSEKLGRGSAQSNSTNNETLQLEPEPLSERDQKATRTFAILRMEPGRNPWDLGAMGNWKTVMGKNLLDWVLPIRRSPCCNHESDISQFVLGAHFEKLKIDNGLASTKDIRSPRPFSGPPPLGNPRTTRQGQEIKMDTRNQPP